jgi:hypothetical protein
VVEKIDWIGPLNPADIQHISLSQMSQPEQQEEKKVQKRPEEKEQKRRSKALTIDEMIGRKDSNAETDDPQIEDQDLQESKKESMGKNAWFDKMIRYRDRRC